MLTHTASELKESNHFLPDFCNNTFTLRLLLTIQLFAFILYIVIHSAQNTLWSWATLGVFSLFMQWITLVSIACLCCLHRLLMTLSVFWCSTLCIIVTITVIGLTTYTVYSNHFLHTELNITSSFENTLISNILIGFILTCLILRYTYLQHQLIKRERAEIKAKLSYLQARIHPHFLFNSLNNIASLIPEKPELAEEVIEDLAVLLRACMTEETYLTTLEQELNLAKKYLHIEKLRLDKPLRIVWNIPSEVHKIIQVPYLILQPLLENAIKHGIQPDKKEGLITITLAIDKHTLTIYIKNSLPLESYTQKPGLNIGLNNTHERLYALYGDKARLITCNNPQMYTITLKIPIDYEYNQINRLNS